MSVPYIFAVDFDGTLCENKWPEIGGPNSSLIECLKEAQKAGDKLILWTCRTGQKLEDAICWCNAHGLIFDAVNKNLPEQIELFGEDCRKVYADAYVDDRNVPIDKFWQHATRRLNDGCRRN